MKQYVNLPIADLVSDVPVDSVHVKELADSIKSRGQLNPVIVRTETKEVIDGFHRVAAMAELGFDHVECVITPCTDEEFWDFRIIQASLHKNVTFARAIDWIDKVFRLNPGLRSIGERYSKEGKTYKNAYTLFAAVRQGTASPEITKWATDKAKVWGLAVATIENWLSARESLEPSLLEEVRHSVRGEAEISPAHYIAVARELPTKPGLQRQVVEKIKAEDLSTKEIRTLSQALRRADDEEEVQGILRQPVSRTEEQILRDVRIEKLLSQPRKQINIPLPQGKYRTIIIDPPWPIEKILREVRPNQVLLDYPTMTIEEIKVLPVPELAYEDGCHIYLWTTHKYLPMAFKVLDAWGANYECLLTWVKNVGITPFSWMYSTEHCLFARIGNLPLLKLGKRLDFEAKVREHSRKPDEFYNLVKEVSPEPRIDMFSREKREGFAQYGNELDRFSSKQVSVSKQALLGKAGRGLGG